MDLLMASSQDASDRNSDDDPLNNPDSQKASLNKSRLHLNFTSLVQYYHPGKDLRNSLSSRFTQVEQEFLSFNF